MNPTKTPSFSAARFAIPATTISSCVFGSVLVSLWTMSLSRFTCSGSDSNLMTVACLAAHIIFAIALSALTSLSIHSEFGIRGVVGMALWAVRSSAEVFPGLTSLDVDQSRDWFYVERVDAASDSAQVIKFQPFGDWSHEQRIRRDVSLYHPTSHRKVSVATLPDMGHPKPAAGFRYRQDVRKKSLFDGLSHLSIISRLRNTGASL